MMRRLAMLVGFATALLAASASAGSPPHGCDGTPGPSGAIEATVGDAKREFLVRLPAGYDARHRRPVVLVFHGFTMNAGLMETLVDFAGAWPEAIFVYPQGLPRQFESIRVGAQPGWQVRKGELGDRDLAFFDAIVEWLRRNQCIDGARVFAAGYSNGAFFAHLLACVRPKTVAGIAASAGGMTCAPAEPTAVIMSHGIRDPLVRYDDATSAAGVWALRNGCGEPPRSGAPACASAASCKGPPVVLCTHAGGHELDPTFPREAMTFLKGQRRERPSPSHRRAPRAHPGSRRPKHRKPR